jgi:hypothetical protein
LFWALGSGFRGLGWGVSKITSRPSKTTVLKGVRKVRFLLVDTPEVASG